jgi:hypothetical protein
LATATEGDVDFLDDFTDVAHDDMLG